jgi:hypothetical protein
MKYEGLISYIYYLITSCITVRRVTYILKKIKYRMKKRRHLIIFN